MRRSRATGVPFPAAVLAGAAAGIIAGLIGVAILLATRSHVPPMRATFWSCALAGVLAGIIYAMWTRISPRPVAALWITVLLVATIDTVVIFALPFPTAGRHLGVGFLAGIMTPLLQILALFGIGGFGRGHMPTSFLGIYAAVHYMTAVVTALVIPALLRRRSI